LSLLLQNNRPVYGISGFCQILKRVSFASDSRAQQFLDCVLSGWAGHLEAVKNAVNVCGCETADLFNGIDFAVVFVA
jgi:hypothetical protein